MKKTLQSVLVLAQIQQFLYFVCITTLLGVAASQGHFNWQFIIILIANWLAVGFGYMYTSIENAPEDALLEVQHDQNPIAAGLISPKTARNGTFISAVLSIGLYSLLGGWCLVLGLLSLLISLLYASRNLRLKSIPIINILSYSLILAGLPFLCGYASFASDLSKGWIWPFGFVISIAIISKYYKDSRPFTMDTISQSQKTTSTLTSRTTQLILLTSLIIGLISAVNSFIVMELIPIWVLILILILTSVLILSHAGADRHPQRSAGTIKIIQKSLEKAAATALLMQFIIPWLSQFITWKIF